MRRKWDDDDDDCGGGGGTDGVGNREWDWE